MKRKFKFVALLATLVCVFICFCGCNTYGSVLSDFKKAGYSETESIAEYQAMFEDIIYGKDDEGNQEEESDVVIHVLYRNESSSFNKSIVVIAEFESKKALKERYSESTLFQRIIKDLNNSQQVNGNCVLLFDHSTDGAKIFEKA